MRGVGPVPVMSPMSKSIRKRERSSGASRHVKNSSNSNNSTAVAGSPSKKPKLTTVTDCSEHPLPEKHENATSSPALSGASSLSTSSPKVGPSISSPSTPDRPGHWSLRPRQTTEGIVRRTRRPYYEVHLTEDDATKLLGHRIKMWWPLDERWYNGEIKNYDSGLRQHWIAYDDGDKEWVKLELETFKLQLLPGDSFERASNPKASSYRLVSPREDVNKAADVCSRLDENPSSRTASEDNSSAQNISPGNSGGKTVSVFVRRRHSRNGSRGSASLPVTSAASTVEVDTIEVQSPIRVCELSKTALSLEDQEVTFGEENVELGIEKGIDKQPEQQDEDRMVDSVDHGKGTDRSLKTDTENYLSPREMAFNLWACSLTLPFLLKLIKSGAAIFNLRKIFDCKWKELTGTGLRLSFNESFALLSSRYLPVLLTVHRLNTQAVIVLQEALPQVDTTGSTDLRTDLQELLSMSKKGRRTIKSIKRISQDEGLILPPPKRIRIAAPETPVEEPTQEEARPRGNILKLRRCPTKKGMWCVAKSMESTYDELGESPAEKKRSSEYGLVDDDVLGDSDAEISDDLYGDEPSDKKHRRGAFGGFEVHKSDGSELPSFPIYEPCTANLLIVESDRGWRETGATVELQRDGDSTVLVVSLNGELVYTYKAYRRIPPGISNKYTHALMWRGGKDWILEFPDKVQWSCFRSMHDASCDANTRAMSVKHIPIPGVREVVDCSDPSVLFFRPRGVYIYQSAGEIEVALSSSRVLYDMDSEDEEWLSEVNLRNGEEITEETFEKVMHSFERAAYVEKLEISLPVALELCSPFASANAISLIHEHWLERRQKLGMALIRCFQPAACDRYEAALKTWKDSPKQNEQPPVFAFCMRPKGSHKMNRQRSQRRTVHYLEDTHGLKNVPVDAYSLDSEFLSGSPGSDIVEDGTNFGHSQRLGYRPKSKGRKPGKKPRRMKSISGNEEYRKGVRTFIAPATVVNLDESEPVDVDSCSSMDFDLNDDALAKAQLARKAARIAAAKAARAQELYAVADAAMKKAVACLIEAEALAAAEKAGRENGFLKDHHENGEMKIEEEEGAALEEEEEDLLLPISNWTQEFGSGLIQKGDASVASPRKSLRYINQSSLFKGMVS